MKQALHLRPWPRYLPPAERTTVNYLTLIDLMDACGVACVLLNSENTILSVNVRADALLCGGGQLPGQKLPASVAAIVEGLRVSSEDGRRPVQAAPLVPRASLEEAGNAFFTDVLPPESAPGPYARIAFGRYVSCQALVSHPLLPGDTQLLILRDASRDHALDMVATALDQVHETVVMCDEEDRMYFCNKAALDIDDLVFDRVQGQPIWEIYESEDTSPLIIPEARKSKAPSLNHRQYYHTKSGQRRETIANFYPVLRGGNLPPGANGSLDAGMPGSPSDSRTADTKTRPLPAAGAAGTPTLPGQEGIHGVRALGAFSVLEDWDTASSLQRKVIDLQGRLLDLEGTAPEGVLRARHEFADFVQQSPVAKSTVKACSEAAATGNPVFLYGEPGTGKHFLAQCIHRASSRAAGPFLQFSCASLPHALLDAMLYGTVRGAYPEAEDKKGLLEQAEGGTLYLADIEAMAAGLQHKLLRTLQGGSFCRLGSDAARPLHVRFLISTSLAPERALTEKRLDPALYSFVQQGRIMVPPLRNRRQDIIPLTMEFVNDYNRRYGKHVVTVSDDVFSVFRKYRWAGNIKELKQTLAHALAAVPDGADLLTTEYLPQRIAPKKRLASAFSSSAVPTDAVVIGRPADNEALKDTVAQIRRQSIYQILLKHGGNITKTAAEMGLSRQNLQYHIRACGIDLAEIRAAARKK